jgi:hypothetical protein
MIGWRALLRQHLPTITAALPLLGEDQAGRPQAREQGRLHLGSGSDLVQGRGDRPRIVDQAEVVERDLVNLPRWVGSQRGDL